MRVIIDNATKLYETWIETGNATTYRYYYGSNPDSTTQLNRKNFIDAMCLVMADKPKVFEKIRNKFYHYGNLDDLLTYYQTGVQPDDSGTSTEDIFGNKL